MSEVISFRLDPDNPREASAILVIQAWKEKGFSIRQIMAEALLKLKTNDKSDENLSDLYRKLEEISDQIEAISSKNPAVINKIGESSEKGLSRQFMQSIKLSVLPGIRSNSQG